MAAVYGYTESYDYTQSYDVADLRRNRKATANVRDSIFGHILNNKDTQVFSFILQLSGLQHTFDTRAFGSLVYGGYTMFVPTDKALKARGLDMNIVANLDRGTAYRLVKYCTLQRGRTPAILMQSPLQEFPTLLDGFHLILENTSCSYNSVVVGDTIIQNQTEGPVLKTATGYDAGFIGSETECANGYVYLIDNLLVPDYGPLRECVVHGFSDPARV